MVVIPHFNWQRPSCSHAAAHAPQQSPPIGHDAPTRERGSTFPQCPQRCKRFVSWAWYTARSRPRAERLPHARADLLDDGHALGDRRRDREPVHDERDHVAGLVTGRPGRGNCGVARASGACAGAAVANAAEFAADAIGRVISWIQAPGAGGSAGARPGGRSQPASRPSSCSF